jgi:glycosyl transferase family 25
MTRKSKMPKSISWTWKEHVAKSVERDGGCFENFRNEMGVFVISCGTNGVRYEKFKKHARKEGVKACHVPCIRGKDFSDKLICEMRKNKVVSPHAEMTKVEISINMSHYNCWQRLINSRLEYALILEDDVEVKPGFISKLNELMVHLEKKNISFSILHLWNGNWSKSASDTKYITKIGDTKIIQETVPYNAGATSYIISKTYAKFLMARSFPILTPQDQLMGHFPKEGRHLSVYTPVRRGTNCPFSPFSNLTCDGPGGTGEDTTQTYDAPTMDALICKK